MSNFTEEQISELEKIFGLQRVTTTNYLRVRDGMVEDHPDTELWWRSEHGAELVKLRFDNHRQNCINYPDVYQIKRPKFGGYVD